MMMMMMDRRMDGWGDRRMDGGVSEEQLYLLCREYRPLTCPEPEHPGVGQLDGWRLEEELHHNHGFKSSMRKPAS